MALLGLASYALIAYVISWVYFFVTLPLVVRLVGGNKTAGVALNYGISWALMLAVLYALQKLMRGGATGGLGATQPAQPAQQ
jgi:hypothetical protein